MPTRACATPLSPNTLFLFHSADYSEVHHAAACLIFHSFVFLNSVALYGCSIVCFFNSPVDHLGCSQAQAEQLSAPVLAYPETIMYISQGCPGNGTSVSVCVCVCVCVTEILLAWNLVKHNQLHISERIYHVYLPTGQLLDIPFKIN